MVLIFPNLCLWRRSLRSNLGGIEPEKLYRATLSWTTPKMKNPHCLTPVPRPVNYEHYLKKELFLIPGTGQYKCCRDSFLFSLVNPSGTGPIKMPLRGTSNHNGILCNGSFGPIFGAGHDLLISNEPNANSESITKLGHTYQCPDDVNSSFLAGLSDFVVNELEVFMFQP